MYTRAYDRQEVHMRTECKVATLSLALVFAACAKRQEPTASLPDDLKKDLAAASASSSALASAPNSYQRMRFVSDIERARVSVPAKRPKVSRHPTRMAASHQSGSEATDLSADASVSLASSSPAPASTPEAPVPEPSIAVAGRPAPGPMSAPAGTSEGGAAENGRGGGLGGMLGGIIGAVIIRGGHVGPDKCDPRTDGRARGTITDRPDFGMPLPVGQPTFPRRW
jgi:hypothetical protein